MNKTIKRGAVIAAGAATVLSLVVATPSFAHSKTAADGTSTSTSTKVAHAHATVAVTVTGVPTTVTDAHAAGHGATFEIFTLDAAATAVPATKPTTGGKTVHVKGGTLANGTVTGELTFHGGAASTTTKYAVYSSTGAVALVTVTVDAAGVATATSSAALTATYDAAVAAAHPAKPADGSKPAGKGGKGGKGHKDGRH